MNWPEDFINKIICGDCLEVMKEMPAKSIDMVITSPPYWGLRDYGFEQIFGGDKDCEHDFGIIHRRAGDKSGPHGPGSILGPTKHAQHDVRMGEPTKTCSKCQAWKGQLGLEPTPELYIEHLTEIFNEVKRILKKEGTLWLNIGDTYWGGKGKSGYPLPHDEDRRHKEGKTLQHGYQVPGYMEMRPPDGKHDFIQPKCLTMIPERLAWSLIQSDWILRNKIIWYKPNSMPSSVKDRYTNKWEYVFMFNKSDKPVYWTNEKTFKLVIKQPLGIKGKEGEDWEWREIREEIKKHSFWKSHNYYFDLDSIREPHSFNRWSLSNPIKSKFAKQAAPGQTKHSWQRKGQAGYYDAEGNLIVHPLGKNPGDIWIIPTVACPFPGVHFATFPEKLCKKAIIPGCPEEVCKKCGKARERIIEKKIDSSWEPKYESRYKNSHGCAEMGNPRSRHINTAIEQALHTKRKTIGWTSCNCKAGFEGRIVLDPFCGVGTALYVAKELRRRFIGIDIKKEYYEKSEIRLSQGVL